MTERPTYSPLDDVGALAWFAPAFACGFGVAVGTMLLVTSGLTGAWLAVPLCMLLGCIFFLRGTLRHVRRQQAFYADGVEVVGHVASLGVVRAEIEYEYDGQRFTPTIDLPSAIAESLKEGGPVVLLVDPRQPSRCVVVR